jgi:hypothetical protein
MPYTVKLRVFKHLINSELYNWSCEIHCHKFDAINVGCPEKPVLFVHELPNRWRKVSNRGYQRALYYELQPCSMYSRYIWRAFKICLNEPLSWKNFHLQTTFTMKLSDGTDDRPKNYICCWGWSFFWMQFHLYLYVINNIADMNNFKVNWISE